MITATQIRKVFKSAVFDPKPQGTEYHIAARELTPGAHYQRAKMLIIYYIEGVKGREALLQAIWNLACGIAKDEEVRNKEQGK